ncbi:sensor histidine kinase [Allonocardiopsis opalescens]|uniref:histidine kinase n=1 Tax=Allonocardiopsis opalescens TaxID=1144618 RepID=A0A2T0Q2V4_9ACTN|nr:histidine kinase [Allonocardiopsis opalescens]PRX98123.1 signal transduction histidine kinase [Allonocardiopsis opalescens]
MSSPDAGRRAVPSPMVQDGALALAVLVPDLLYYSALITPGATAGQRLSMLGLASLGTAALLLRSRRPVGVYLAVWAYATGSAVLSLLGAGFFTPFTALLVALYTVAVARPLWAALAALAAAAVPCLLFVVNSLVDEAEPEQLTSATIGLTIFYGLQAAGACAVGRWVRVTRAAAEVERRRLAESRQATALERARIARELHDIVAHAVTVMVLQASGARRVLAADPARAADALGHIEDLGKSAMTELRRMLVVMRGHEVPQRSLSMNRISDLDELLDGVRMAGIQVRLEVVGEPVPLPESVELTAYRLVQEAVTNITKHAGPGTAATVRLDWSAGSARLLRIEVVDDGKGVPPSNRASLSTGHGLLGLAERVAVFGGRLDAAPYRTGYRVAASLPVLADPASPSPRPAPHRK